MELKDSQSADYDLRKSEHNPTEQDSLVTGLMYALQQSE
jgi:hypothetical protein